MGYMQISANSITYVSYNTPNANCSRDKMLKVGAYYTCIQNGYVRNLCRGLMNFDLSELEVKCKRVKRATLVLEAEQILFESYTKSTNIMVCPNIADYQVDQVTWNNSPGYMMGNIVSASEVIQQSSSGQGYGNYNKSSEIGSKTVNIDMTNMVKEWLGGNLPNKGITLVLEPESGYVEIVPFATKGGIPKLIVDYEECMPTCNDVKQCCPEATVVGIELQTTDKRNKSIYNNSPVLFNLVSNCTEKGIGYQVEDGTIVINSPGYYYCDWWVSLDGAGNVEMISFVLDIDCGKKQIMGMTQTAVQLQLIGNGLIHVKDNLTKIRLLNNSGDIVQFADIPIQADLTIFKIG